jgi:hypothetical protein
MPHNLATMSKESLIKAVEDYGCGKLKTLPLAYMTKEQIITHLKECECPVIRKLLRGQI